MLAEMEGADERSRLGGLRAVAGGVIGFDARVRPAGDVHEHRHFTGTIDNQPGVIVLGLTAVYPVVVDVLGVVQLELGEPLRPESY